MNQFSTDRVLDWGDIKTKHGAALIIEELCEELNEPSNEIGRLRKPIYAKCLELILELCKEVGYTHVCVGGKSWDKIPYTDRLMHTTRNMYDGSQTIRSPRGLNVIAAFPAISAEECKISNLPSFYSVDVIWCIVDLVDKQSPLDFAGRSKHAHMRGIIHDTLPTGRWTLEGDEWIKEKPQNK